VPDPAWWPTEGEAPDYRASLANERTLLAYTRTALAFAVAGAAVIGTPLLTDGPAWLALVGVLPVVAGALVAVGARRRYLDSERAMRTGAPLPPPLLAVRTSTGVAVAALLGGPLLGLAVVLSR
jgi:putative membrane protein